MAPDLPKTAYPLFNERRTPLAMAVAPAVLRSTVSPATALPSVR